MTDKPKEKSSAKEVGNEHFPAQAYKAPKQFNSKAYTASLTELNRNIRINHRNIRKLRTPPKYFARGQLEMVYKKWNGRCAYCGSILNVRDRRGSSVLKFHLYTPLENGGRIETDNLVPCCSEHYKSYRPRRRLREEISDINTFADLTEALVKTLIQLNVPSKDALYLRDKIQRIKRMMNYSLEDLAINMRYQPFKDWRPDKFEILREGENSIPDLIEALTTSELDDEVENVEEEKKEVTDKIKQVVTSKQYKIVE